MVVARLNVTLHILAAGPTLTLSHGNIRLHCFLEMNGDLRIEEQYCSLMRALDYFIGEFGIRLRVCGGTIEDEEQVILSAQCKDICRLHFVF